MFQRSCRFSNLLLLWCFTFSTRAIVVQSAFCQAVNGIYSEESSPSSTTDTKTHAKVNLELFYDIHREDIGISTPPTAEWNPIAEQKQQQQSQQQQQHLDDATIIDLLIHRLSDALVFTLFEQCRVDAVSHKDDNGEDIIATVNLQSMVVLARRVSATAYEVQIQVVAADETAVTSTTTSVFSQLVLETAVRHTLATHHVSTLPVAPHVKLTLRPKKEPPATNHPTTPVVGTPHAPSIPSSTTTSTTPVTGILPLFGKMASGGGCFFFFVLALFAVVAMTVFRNSRSTKRHTGDDNDTESLEEDLFIPSDHTTKHVHWEANDDIELATTTKKPVTTEHLDETEVSESYSGYDFDDDDDDDDEWHCRVIE